MSAPPQTAARDPAIGDRAGHALRQSPVSQPTGRPIRILHSVGHLVRGGIETWLHQVVQRLQPPQFEHHVLVWTEAEEAFTPAFRAAGATVLPCLGRPDPLRFARSLRGLIRRHGPYDLLHTHGTQFHGYVMLLARSFGIPRIVAHSHTDIQPVLATAGLPYRGYAAAGHAVIRRCAAAGFAVSDLAAISMFGPRWRDDPRWRLLYCGIDLDQFRQAPDPGLRARLGIPPDRLVIGHVGRFQPQKNQQFVIEVAQAALAMRPDLHVLLMGDGPDRADVMAAAQRMGIAAHLTVIPDCTTVPLHLLSAVDRFIFPSRYEGLGLAAVEAQAAGLSCLVSDIVPAEVVVNPDRVRRLPLGQGAAAWVTALLDLPSRSATQPEDLLRMFRGSRFDMEQSARLLAEAYATVLHGPLAAPLAGREAHAQ